MTGDDSAPASIPRATDRKHLSPPVEVDPRQQADERAKWLTRSRAAWDARAMRWHEKAEALANSEDRAADLERIWLALALEPGARLLDAGCGSGQFAIPFARRGAFVTGVDLSPQMIRLAAEGSQGEDLCVDWRVGDLGRLPDSDATYDAILARMVLPFVPDLRATLEEFRRVLRPGGRLLASVPGALSPIYRDSWLRHLPGGDPGNSYLLPWELEALLTKLGWTILDGWGDWGTDLYATENATAGVHTDPVAVQQATATTWTILAG
jgi:SAM-dependent methyltransferase